MNKSLADQLKEIAPTLSISDYGRLPKREDVLLLKTQDALPIWEKLNTIRLNLKILDNYIKSNSKESLSKWSNNDGASRISKLVLDRIGQYNNETGGISAGFLDLQNIYDQEEEKYDAIEAASDMAAPDKIKTFISQLRKEREEKRKTRRQVRKIKLKDLEKDGKGFIVIDAPLPLAADAETAETISQNGHGGKADAALNGTANIKPSMASPAASAAAVASINNTKQKVGYILVSVVGVTILIGAIYGIATSNK